MSDIQLIGLSGKVSSGKDYIAAHYLKDYRKLSFAWLLKWIAVAQDRVSWEEAFVTKPKAARDVLQQMGTDEWRKQYGADVWVRGFEAITRTLAAEWGINKFVVADVRFPNEVAAVQRLGKVIRVVAPNRVAASRLTPEQRLHESEIALDHLPDSAFDAIVYNDFGQESNVPYQIEKAVGLFQLDLAI